MKRLRVTVAMIGCGLAFAACAKDEVSVSEIRGKSVSMTAGLVRELGDSLDFVTTMESATKITDGIGSMSSPVSRAFPASEEPAPLPYPGQRSDAQTEGDGEYGPAEAGDEAATEIEKVLEEYVFADSNLEDSGEDWALFLVKAETVCPKLRDEEVDRCATIDWGCGYMDPPDPYCLQGEADDRVACTAGTNDSYAECMDKLPKLALRAKVTLVDGDEDKLDVEILVAPAKYNPVSFALRPDSIGVDFDLAAIEATVQHVADVFGETAPVFPDEFVGIVGLALKKNAARDFTTTASIKEALRVAGSFETTSTACTWDSTTGSESCTDTTETHHLAFASEVADPLVSVRAQANERKLTVGLDINKTMLTMPWAEVFDFGERTGDFIVDLAGFNGELVLQDGVEALVLNSLGFGQGRSSVRHDAIELAAVELNADNGGVFNQLTTLVGDLPLFTFDPSVVLEAYVNLGHINAFLAPEEEPAPAVLCDQTYTLSLLPGSAAPAITPFLGSPDLADDDALKVASGTLTLSSSAAPADTVTVGEGMCLFGTDTLAEGAHELLGHFYAGACE